MSRKGGAQFQAQRPEDQPSEYGGTAEVPLRATALIPGTSEDPAIILGYLAFQNPTLRTGSWRVYKGKKENKERVAGAGWILIVGIPVGVAAAVKALDFRPYLGSDSHHQADSVGPFQGYCHDKESSGLIPTMAGPAPRRY